MDIVKEVVEYVTRGNNVGLRGACLSSAGHLLQYQLLTSYNYAILSVENKYAIPYNVDAFL